MIDFTICLVTRGDVPLEPLIESYRDLGSYQIVVYDNALEPDRAVFGRYLAAFRAKTELVFVQDDDCVLEADAIMQIRQAWKPGAIAANMPAAFRHDFYTDHCLVGFGAMFARSTMVEIFQAWQMAGQPIEGEHFDRTCDIVLTALAHRILVDVPYRNLEWAEAPNRMWKQPEHVGERTRMLADVRSLNLW